ncbi:Gfo/Idh/MocA family oxidoreductase [Nitrosopumilus sp.]|nr:Gfo/Idh/MocA family oxidoreductase [Nitrosopumilus sp.]
MKKILLIGCGNIGSRHLQALLKLKFKTEIDVVEINKKNILLAKQLTQEVSFKKHFHHITWLKNIVEIQKIYDLVIVSTQASGRAKLLNLLIQKGNSLFLVEKIVCQSKEEYQNLLKNCKKHGVKSWVNTRCRYFDSYKKIKKTFSNSLISLSMNSSDTGLSTGAIHYLDLFSWLTNDTDIILDGKYLSKKIYKNKRSSCLVEFGGTIFGKSKNGSEIKISYFPKIKSSLTVEILGNNNHYLIDEYEEQLWNLISDKKICFKQDFVSNTTTKIVEDIFKKQSCDLPTLEDLYFSHCELFRIFNKHLKKTTNKKPKLCPIT